MNDRLRIGLVCPYSFSKPGGVQNHVLGLAGHFKAQGHSVGILAPGEPDQGVLAGYGLDDYDFTSAGTAMPIKFNGSVARINFGPRQWGRVKAWLDNGWFDVVHVHEPMSPSVSLMAVWLTALPVVATFHTSMPIMRWIKVANAVAPKAVKRIDCSIAVSSLAQEVAHQHFKVDPVIIGNGIDVSDHELHRCEGPWRGGDVPRITFLGRYNEPRKGFDVLRAALPAVQAVYPDLDVAVAGGGTPVPTPGVRFLGFLPDAERNALLGSSDVYVAPNTGRESFGIVLLEALASGAPVVASDLKAFRDVLTDDDGVVGELFSNGDAADLARALLVSLGRPRDLFVERGRARAEQFDWSVLAPRILGCYQEAMDAVAARRARTGLGKAD